jgi:class 3 adenylate cyclase
MFPENVRDRLMEDALQDEGKTSAGGAVRDETNAFFPEATIMFADISGFTAWASTENL